MPLSSPAPRAVRALAAALLLLAGIALAPAARAQDAGLYEGEVQVASQDAGAREAVLPRALGQVLGKLSGDAGVAARPEVAARLGEAASLLAGHRYRADQELIGGVPVTRQVLVARFDQPRVDALAAGLGLRVWPQPRPVPQLWLAIDDGRGARLVGRGQVNAVRSLLARGTERGLAFRLPEGGEIEQAGVAAVQALDAGALEPLAARYGDAPRLLGTLARGGRGWVARWVLADADGSEISRWTTDLADPRAAIAAGADGAADALAARDAVMLVAGTPGVHVIEIRGVRDQADWLRVSGYLQGLAVVASMVPERVDADGGRLAVRLDLATGLEGFAALVAGGQVLRAADAPAEGGAPAYDLQPAR